MKETVKIITTGVVSGLFVFYLMNGRNKTEVENIQEKYNNLILLNSELKTKLESTEEVYDVLRKKETFLKRKLNKTKSEMTAQEQVLQDLLILEEKYEKEQKRLDSLKSEGPNRSEEDLIKSLKQKTQI